MESTPSLLETTSTNTQESVGSDAAVPPLHLLLDAGYGIPREARPRQEKVLAIAKQIANFLAWQCQQQDSSCSLRAPVTVVGCPNDDMKTALLERLKQLWGDTTEIGRQSAERPTTVGEESSGNKRLPPHFSFAKDLEHSNELLQNAVYLSPDASSALDPCGAPPSKVIVGLLIDRRIQPNRSLNRSEKLEIPPRRWPMEVIEDYHHPQEPLNVDTILEALQQWSWNHEGSSTTQERHVQDDTPFRRASLQAFQHHAQRHPARPKHKP
ncbi:expressed unknown protein [Seminavis robusta]|uniref:SAM-dependent MTase TRM10-type domain-containing protein n=1 Tax=Seminavis robusta TaxID=568900 RepID=A0A9N8HJW6_9STRA|nr:expressed unknown protein [Seminavis robusta]|eukprot:Sro577_g169640.1 n/a (268) ;mRNA; f:15158-15961